MHPMTQHSACALSLSAVLLALSALISASHALAETSPAIDMDSAPIINSYWYGSIPSGDLVGVSTDVALPLALGLHIGSVSVNVSLSFIEITVVPADTPSAVPVEGYIRYAKAPQLVLWIPKQPLDPSTTYTVNVLVNNEELSSSDDHPNISGSFNITTSASALTASPPTIRADSTVTFTPTKDRISCPNDETICQDIVDEGSGSSHTYCTSIALFTWEKPFIQIAWDDGEETGAELFFTYLITAREGEIIYDSVDGQDVLESTHSSTLALSLFDAQAEDVCLTIQATDLRIFAHDSDDGVTTTTHCISLAGMPPLPDTEALLADCTPRPKAPTEDVLSGDDTDTNSGPDTGAELSSEDIEASACSCTTTRTSPNQAPAGLLLGLAIAFGAALSLRRRKASPHNS
jgi:hypothetical protein